MKFNKSLIAFAVAGAMTVPALHAAEHTFSWGGNLRVESISETADLAQPNSTDTASVATLRTAFGGIEDESTTGGDTQIQLSYGYSSDDGSTTGSGFIRFASDRQVRLNIEASSEGDVYAASMKAEWEQLGLAGFDGAGEAAATDRDQFAVLTHKPTGVYFKIGREEWFGNEKGYTTDFLSQTKGFADTGTDRVNGHVLGWKDSDLGLDVGLFIQRDNTGQAFARPFGYEFEADKGVQDVNGFGVIAKYASGPVDLEFITGSSTAETNPDRPILDEDDNPVDSPAEYERAVAITQVHLAVPLGQYTPFFNLGTATITDTEGGVETEATDGGNNVGVSINFGYADLVVAFGSATSEDDAEVETTESGFDLMFATNQDPLLVSFAVTSSSTEVGDAEATNNMQFGVRFDYGF